jgi:toxin YoeB
VSRAAGFQPDFHDDLMHWVRTDRATAVRVLQLVEATLREPFEGLGKPERLRHLGANTWSRRITQEHRLVYVVSGERIDFVQCRYRY